MTKRYSPLHKAVRESWAPRVASGTTQCAEAICFYADRRIHPEQPWDLAHSPDGTTYLGPAHAKCNRSEGARRRQDNLGRKPRVSTVRIVDSVNQW